MRKALFVREGGGSTKAKEETEELSVGNLHMDAVPVLWGVLNLQYQSTARQEGDGRVSS